MLKCILRYQKFTHSPAPARFLCSHSTDRATLRRNRGSGAVRPGRVTSRGRRRAEISGLARECQSGLARTSSILVGPVPDSRSTARSLVSTSVSQASAESSASGLRSRPPSSFFVCVSDRVSPRRNPGIAPSVGGKTIRGLDRRS